MTARLPPVLLIVLVAAAAGCRVPMPGVVPGTVCDADAVAADIGWWESAPPLEAMNRVTQALRLKVEHSEKIDALRGAIDGGDDRCRKVFYDGCTATHEKVSAAGAALEQLKAGRPRDQAYDPELAKLSFATYCTAAWDFGAFAATVEECLGR